MRTKKCLLMVLAATLAMVLGVGGTSPTVVLADEGEDQIEIVVTHNPFESIKWGPMACSWYGSSLYMYKTTSVSGSTRYYDGSNVGIEMTCTTGGTNACDSYFSVELHRVSGFSDTYIGSAAFKHNGFTKATWTNVGSGNYYFKFVKCSDTQSISSNSVAMYSW